MTPHVPVIPPTFNTQPTSPAKEYDTGDRPDIADGTLTYAEVTTFIKFRKLPAPNAQGVIDQDQCWTWTQTNRNCQEMMMAQLSNGLRVSARRLAWRIYNGPLPKGKHVKPTCDKPYCCHPGHMTISHKTSKNWLQDSGAGDYAVRRMHEKASDREIAAELCTITKKLVTWQMVNGVRKRFYDRERRKRITMQNFKQNEGSVILKDIT